MTSNFLCKLALHSRNLIGDEVITYRLRYERFIHAEIMTHRVSRNASSARAIPYEKMKAMVRAEPAVHLHLGSNRPGMQSGQEINDTEGCRADILSFLSTSLAFCDWLHTHYKLHKEIINRYFEEFSWINVVMTFSRPALMNMFSLRLTPHAHPNFQRLAKHMAIQYRASVPQKLEAGQWHLPFVEDKFSNILEDSSPRLEEAKAWSVARSAWVSYLTVEEKDATLEDAQRRYQSCIDLKHVTPLEHQKRARDDSGRNGGTTPGFDELRHMISNESATEFDFSVLDTTYKDMDFVVP